MTRKPTRGFLISMVPLVAAVVAGCAMNTTTDDSAGASPALCQTSGPAQEIGMTGHELRTFTFDGSLAVFTAKAASGPSLAGPAKVVVYLGPKSEPPTINPAQDPIQTRGATMTMEVTNGLPTMMSIPSGDYWVATLPWTSLKIQPCEGSSVGNIAPLLEVNVK